MFDKVLANQNHHDLALLPISGDPVEQQQFQQLAKIVLFKQRHLLARILAQKKFNLSKISIPQFLLLELLSDNRMLNMGQLAKRMGHTTPATTGLINRLILNNWVERISVPNDRRQILIKITPAGQFVVDQLKTEIIRTMQEVGVQMTPQDRQAWFRVNGIIYEYIKNL